MRPTSPIGLHRVVDPPGVLPQAARVLDPDPAVGADEVRVRVEALNLDAASYRQLEQAHGGDGAAVRAAVLAIVAERGKMQNPVTGSGGMLVGVVEEVGPESPLGLRPGDRIASLVSLSLTPLRIEDGLSRWDGRSERVPCDGTAILFGRSIAAVLPDDLPADLAMSVFDVCGAPALVARVVADRIRRGLPSVVAVIGGAGKSGSLALAAARATGATRTIGVVPIEAEAVSLRGADLADAVALADARDPVALAEAVASARGSGRHHGRVRRRPRLRARGDPGHRRGRRRHLLLDGHLLHRGGARRGGARRRRHDARRQRLRPRPRRRTPSTCCAGSPGARGLFEARLAREETQP